MEAERRFRELFVSTYPALRRYARHRGLSGQDVDDLVAATYEVAWRRLERVPDGEAALPWLLAVALNHVRNRRRRLERDRRLVERLAAPEQPSPPPEPGGLLHPGGPAGCPGGGGAIGPVQTTNTAGQHIHWTFPAGAYPKDCSGNTIRVTVAYVPNAYLGLNGIGSGSGNSPGRGAIIVGQGSVTVPNL